MLPMMTLACSLLIGQPELTDDSFAKVRDEIVPEAEALRWRDVPWRVTLWDAVRAGQREQKPILLYTMNGHPCASVCNNGVYGRVSLWSNPKVQEAAKKFITVADEMYSMFNGKGDEADLFRNLAKHGPGGGRAGTTQQGIYCFAPSGEILGADNTREPERMLRLLESSLARWEQMPAERKYRSDAPADKPAGRTRAESSYPADGLVLRQYVRDLGTTKRSLGDLERPWNTDIAWFNGVEAKSMLPTDLKVGAKANVSAPLVRRLARFHLIDAVVGQGMPFADNHINRADMTLEVTGVDGDKVSIRISGATQADAETRKLDTRILGKGVFDRGTSRFTSLEIVAVGTRQGKGSQPAYIRDEAGAGPIGFVFLLAGDNPADRVAPTYFPAYGWR